MKKPTHIHHDEHAKDPTDPQIPSADWTGRQMEKYNLEQDMKIKKRDELFAKLDHIYDLIQAQAGHITETFRADLVSALGSLKDHIT